MCGLQGSTIWRSKAMAYACRQTVPPLSCRGSEAKKDAGQCEDHCLRSGFRWPPLRSPAPAPGRPNCGHPGRSPIRRVTAAHAVAWVSNTSTIGSCARPTGSDSTRGTMTPRSRSIISGRFGLTRDILSRALRCRAGAGANLRSPMLARRSAGRACLKETRWRLGSGLLGVL